VTVWHVARWLDVLAVQVLENLALVLQLDANERAHLFLLAVRQPPPVETFAPPTISPTLQQFLEQLGMRGLQGPGRRRRIARVSKASITR